ncbi:tetratricopeptide repeat protein [Novispirillum itersonii]|uniref:glycosyltransferase family 41 protein n=1 Tax=Novispirillum itersonii TaxID=189 RepID=UPI0012DF8057|nr:glycosyltransferase family 41 protein [Novispirillum itersonii]
MANSFSSIDHFRKFFNKDGVNFGELEDAVAAEIDALPEDAPKEQLEACYLLIALACLQRGALDRAWEYAFAAHDLNPDRSETCQILSVCGSRVGHFENAAYFLKLLNASVPSDEAWITEFVVPHLPDVAAEFVKIDEAPFEKKGELLLQSGMLEDAERCFRMHLSFFPQALGALIGVVRCLIAANEADAALNMLRAARVIHPDNMQIVDLMAALLHQAGDFRSANALFRSTLHDSADVGRHAFALNHMLEDPTVLAQEIKERQHRLAELVRQGVKGAPLMPAMPTMSNETLTLAYFLDPLRSAAEQTVLADILRHHTAPACRVVGIGIGPLSAFHNEVYKSAVQSWVDVSGLSDRTLARVIGTETPDALIVTGDLRYPQALSLLCNRIAPCQGLISRLPDPLDLPYLDLFFPETVGSALSLPLLQAQDPVPSVVSDGADVLIGLAGDFRDFDPEILASLAVALTSLPKVTLLVQNRGYDLEVARASLLNRFGTFGLAHRVDAVDVVSGLEFCQNSTLLVLPHGSPSSQWVVDALAAGVPCLTVSPPARHLQGPAATLRALGLQSCVAETMSDLPAMVRHWVDAQDERAAFRQNSAGLLAGADLFDLAGHASRIEGAVRAHLSTLS